MIKYKNLNQIIINDYKSSDDIVTKKVLRPLATPIVYFSLKIHLSANHVTLLFITIGIIAGLLLNLDTDYRFLLSGTLLIIHFIIDLADGYVARITGTESKLGFYLDLIGHLIVYSTVFFSIKEIDLAIKIALSILVPLTTSIYAVLFSGIDYSTKLGIDNISNELYVKSDADDTAKALIYFLENPGFGYLFIIIFLFDLEHYVDIILFLLSISFLVYSTIKFIKLLKHKV